LVIAEKFSGDFPPPRFAKRHGGRETPPEHAKAWTPTGTTTLPEERKMDFSNTLSSTRFTSSYWLELNADWPIQKAMAKQDAVRIMICCSATRRLVALM
jgi:hypothetical protein